MSLTPEQADPDEQAAIDAITATAPHRAPWVRLGPGDDGAVLADGSVLVADAMVQGVHWDLRVAPEDVGFKLALVNLSDLAAMGAEPRWALLTLCLPHPIDGGWVSRFAAGLAEGLGPVPLLGGDTTRSPGPITASLTAGGQLVAGALTRSGARPGDTLWVSGVLGAAARAFGGPGPGTADWSAWTRPQPPLSLGPALALAGLATAGLDLSDGLAQDLHRLCAASGVGASVDPSALPLAAGLSRAASDWLDTAVGWGEDYQLLFAAPPGHADAVAGLGTRLGVPLTAIGTCTADPAVVLEGRAWPAGWRHFDGGAHAS